MADGDRFDPRFDPAFQRGFEGEAPPTVPASSVEAPPARPAVEQPRDVVERPDPDAAERAPRRRPPGTGRAATVSATDDAPSQRRNPFLIAAVVIAGLLIVGGVLIFARLPEWRATVQGDALVDFATLQVLYFASPLMVILGIATIIALLILAGSRWRRPYDED